MVRSLLESTGEGIYGADLDGNCTFANPSCLQFLGYKSDADLLGKNMHALVHHTRVSGEPYPVKECRIYRAFWEHQGIHVDDEVMWRSDGTGFPAEYWSYPVERDGELVGCVVTFVDITKRLGVEEELRQSEKMAALGKLAAGLAHELNNPAAAAGRASNQLLDALRELQDATNDLARVGIDQDLWGSLTEWDRLLQRRSDEPKELSPLEASDREEELIDWLESHKVEQGWELASTLVTAGVELEDLERIAATMPPHALGDAIGWLCRSFGTQDLARAVVQSSHSISRLVDAAKSFSYMDQDQVQTIDVHQGIEDTVTMLASRFTDAIEIVREYGHDLPSIQVPASELNQVWMNVLDNALDAVGERGRITIRTREDGSDIVVEIEDDGAGIPPDIENHRWCYALRAMLHIARGFDRGEPPLRLQDLADHLKLTRNDLFPILERLAAAELLVLSGERDQAYRLAKAPDIIQAEDVIAAAGDFTLVVPDPAEDPMNSGLSRLIQNANRANQAVWTGVSLDTLLRESGDPALSAPRNKPDTPENGGNSAAE